MASLSLDDGADVQECGSDAIELSERGMILRSRWRFEIGAQVRVVCVSPSAGGRPRRFTAEGIVVWCEPCGGLSKTYESTLLFLELPDELKEDLRELSYLLGPEE